MNPARLCPLALLTLACMSWQDGWAFRRRPPVPHRSADVQPMVSTHRPFEFTVRQNELPQVQSLTGRQLSP
jgi:hypothetical protein